MNSERFDFNLLRSLLISDRSVRRFRQSHRIGRPNLERLVELTRYCASGRNLQPLKYLIVDAEEDCARLFPLLKWAGYLSDWDGPEEGERPSAYIVQCLDTRLTRNCLCDEGLQLQALTLGATALGLGACIIKSFDATKLRLLFNIPDYLEISYVVALGEPVEKVVIEDMTGTDPDAVKYYRTSDGVHHVPKRPLDSLLIQAI